MPKSAFPPRAGPPYSRVRGAGGSVYCLPYATPEATTIATIKIPRALEPLIEDGLVDDVIRQLKSGKEAMVYLVRCGQEIRCAKIYKESDKRSFRQAVEYQEGRRVKSSRRARAMEKGSRFGRKEKESAWQSAEVDALYKLAAAGVRVPKPYGFFDGVLLMERVADGEGNVAPRLAEVELAPEQAAAFHRTLIGEVVRMLCAGLVHGDLSEFNILVDDDGPVIIDLPQAVDAARNNHAKRMLERDVANLADYLGQFAPQLRGTDFGNEIWAHYEAGTLTPDTPLTGEFAQPTGVADVEAVLKEIEDVRAEAMRRQEWLAAEQAEN